MMVDPMYIWCAKHPTQCSIEPFWHIDIGVVELGKHYGHGLVQKDHPHRSPYQDDSQCGKYKPEHTLSGMVAVGSNRVVEGPGGWSWWWITGGLAVLVILLFWFRRN